MSAPKPPPSQNVVISFSKLGKVYDELIGFQIFMTYFATLRGQRANVTIRLATSELVQLKSIVDNKQFAPLAERTVRHRKEIIVRREISQCNHFWHGTSYMK